MVQQNLLNAGSNLQEQIFPKVQVPQTGAGVGAGVDSGGAGVGAGVGAGGEAPQAFPMEPMLIKYLD